MSRTICVITGSRADYGLLYWLMRELQQDAEVNLKIVVTGMHLDPNYGSTYQVILEDGFEVAHRVEMALSDDSCGAIGRSVGMASSGFADAFEKLHPDMVVLLGDRYEIFAAAVAATMLKIPIAHIHGGEVTEGAMDDVMRHAITKMSHLHFVTAEPYRRRVVQMGELPRSVFNVGAPGLEYIHRAKLMSKEELQSSIDFKFDAPTFLVTYHPVTLDVESSQNRIGTLIEALDSYRDASIIFTGVNADPDNKVIRERIVQYAAGNKGRVAVYTSLGQVRYLSAMKHVDLVIGNSSSGIIEAPAFGTPTVNIGDRQKGRLMAQSIITCGEAKDEIEAAISETLDLVSDGKIVNYDNPYGDGVGGAKAMCDAIKNAPLDGSLLKKRFYDIEYALDISK